MCPYTPPPTVIDAGALEDSYIALFKAGDRRAVRLLQFTEDLVARDLLTVADVASFMDGMDADLAAYHINEYFSVDFAYSILTHANLSADKTQAILYSLPFNSKLIDILTYGAGDLTISSDTSISGVNRYGGLSIASGVTLTVTGQPGALITKEIINNGNIVKSPTGGAGGAAGAAGAGAGGQGGGGLVIFADGLVNPGVISADGEAGENGSTVAASGDGSDGGAGVFYRVGMDEPGLGGTGAYFSSDESEVPGIKGDGGRNGGGGGQRLYRAGDGDGSTYTSFSTHRDLVDEIRKATIDWVIVNVFEKSPTSTVSIPNAYGSGGGGGAAYDGGGACGGGGGGGGEILALCLSLNNTGTIRANGGDGGDGGTEDTDDNEGGGGGGGVIYILYKILVSAGTIQANGGAAGTGDSRDTAATAGSAGLARIQAV